MHRRKTRKQELIQRTVVYTVMTTAVILIVTILALVVLGYSFDKKSNRFVQGGLIQLNSTPRDARVHIDNTLQGRTPTKFTALAADHFVEFKKDGYRNWSKTIPLKAGQVVWLNYARLIPNDIKTSDVATFKRVDSSLASPDRRYVLLTPDKTKPEFTLVTIANNEKIEQTQIKIPDGKFKKAQKNEYKVREWNPDSSSVLVEHMFGKSKEWIVVDIKNPKKTVNISAELVASVTDISFTHDSKKLAVKTTDKISIFNLSDNTLTRVIASGVSHFNVMDDNRVIYTSRSDNDKGKYSLNYTSPDMDVPRTIVDSPYEIEGVSSRYLNARYTAVVSNGSMKIYKGDLPTGDDPLELKEINRAKTSKKEAVSIQASPTGRFFSVTYGKIVTVYDIEMDRFYTYDRELAGKLQWIDGYIHWNVTGGTLSLNEFDGKNKSTIMKLSEGQDVTLSRDDKFIYGIVADKDGFKLRRAALTVNN